nr:MAG TPA: hypothetical protein [Microviridae sp.]
MTQPKFGVVVVYALLCYSAILEIIFHVKHCESNIICVYIIPVIR